MEDMYQSLTINCSQKYQEQVQAWEVLWIAVCRGERATDWFTEQRMTDKYPSISFDYKAHVTKRHPGGSCLANMEPKSMEV